MILYYINRIFNTTSNLIELENKSNTIKAGDILQCNFKYIIRRKEYKNDNYTKLFDLNSNKALYYTKTFRHITEEHNRILDCSKFNYTFQLEDNQYLLGSLLLDDQTEISDEYVLTRWFLMLKTMENSLKFINIFDAGDEKYITKKIQMIEPSVTGLKLHTFLRINNSIMIKPFDLTGIGILNYYTEINNENSSLKNTVSLSKDSENDYITVDRCVIIDKKIIDSVDDITDLKDDFETTVKVTFYGKVNNKTTAD